MTPQELKNSILQLAIQGKLVEQRSEEGSAGNLLIRVQTDKQVDGHRVKEKEISNISEDDIPFELPVTWEWVKLGSVCTIARGGSPRPIKDYITDDANGVNWIKIGDTEKNGKYISSTAEKIKPSGVSKSRMVHAGDFLLTNSMSFGRPYILKTDGCIHDGWLVISQGTVVFDQDYLYWTLSSGFAYSQFCSKVSGAVVKNLNSDKVANALFPLPPLAEQKRIVAKIEELLPLIDRYEKAWTRLEDFNKRFPGDMQKSILQMAIQGKLVEQRPEEGTGEELYRQIQEEKQALIKAGKIKKEKPLPEISEDEIPFEIPESWKWVSVGSVCINVQYGTSSKSSISGKIAVLRMGNIQNGRIVYDKLVYTSDEDEIEKYPLEIDDLLFNRTNSKELVGKTGIYKGEIPAIYAGYLVRLTPLVMNSDFLNYVMQSQYYWGYCQTVRSDAIGQSNINAEKLKRFVFPLPPLAEQKRIVARLEELLPLCDRLKSEVKA